MKKILNGIRDYYYRTDKVLLLLCLICSALSCVILISISEYFFTTKRVFLVQMLASTIGIILAIVISKIDYRTMSDFSKYHMLIAWGLVILTFFIGNQRGGADDRAWISLPLGLSFQPTELAKFSFIIAFATHLDRVKYHINDIKTVLLLCVHGAIPVLIIHFQGDDGTALIFCFIFILMMFMSGLSIRYFIVSGAMLLAAAPFLWFFILSEHQRDRFMTIFNPALDVNGIGYQAYHGKIALGSGGIWGKGLFSGTHVYVPEVHNDFIFAYIGESLGLIGATIVLFLLGGICIKIFMAAKFSEDTLGTLICVGIAGVFISQIILNIGMCLSLMPVIGVTLPLFSAGGTSVVSLYIGIGIVLSVYVHNNDLWFN